MAQLNIFWFRRDLRWRDNHGLWAALKSDFPVLPIFIFDPGILNELKNPEDARVNFIFETLEEMQTHLKSFKSGIRIYHGNPLEVFKGLAKEFSIQSVFCNEDYEPQAILRDQKVAVWLGSQGISFQSLKDQVIFAKNDVLKDDGTPYTVFTPYSRKWLKTLPAKISEYPSEKFLDNLWPDSKPQRLTLQEIGFQKSKLEFPPSVFSKKTLTKYAQARNFPALAGGTSKLGLHLRFGTLSVRRAVQVAQELSPVWLNELIWREFFMMILYHFPKTVNEPFRKGYEKIKWRNNQSDFAKWCAGETGYPFVDAGMRELAATGHMHNRVRMVVASFLTKHLLIDWRWGERFFARYLLDFELSSNVGNWQWAAGCGCDAAPYFRVFNPALQAKKFDPKSEYIQHWVPEFGSPKYSDPMVDHELARRRAIATYQEALKGKEK